MTTAAGSDEVLKKLGADFGSADTYFDSARQAPGDNTDKRAFTYFVLGGARFLYASAVRVAVVRTVATMSASADVLALASLEVDLGAVQEGECITVKWRGKPVFVKHRTADQIAEVAPDLPGLRDPQTDAERTQDPKW